MGMVQVILSLFILSQQSGALVSTNDLVLPGGGSSKTCSFRCLVFSIKEVNYEKSSFLVLTWSPSRPKVLVRFYVGSLLCQQMQKCHREFRCLKQKTTNLAPQYFWSGWEMKETKDTIILMWQQWQDIGHWESALGKERLTLCAPSYQRPKMDSHYLCLLNALHSRLWVTVSQEALLHYLYISKSLVCIIP